MKVLNQSIQLSNTRGEATVVKTCALFTFRALRAVTDQAKKAPGFFAQASADVQDAWRESSRPNV